MSVPLSSLVAVGSTRSEYDRYKPREMKQDKSRDGEGAQVKERVEQKLCVSVLFDTNERGQAGSK